MATNVFTLGLASVKVGEIPTTGLMSTVLAPLGYTLEGTFKLTQDEGEVTEFKAEEIDTPVLSFTSPGKINIEFSLMNPSVETLEKLLGGTADATDNTWKAPDSAPSVELSVEITPRQGYKLEIPRVQMNAKLNGEFSKKSLFCIDIKGTILQPAGAIEKIKLTKIA